ncbi:MAG: hypothetical protein ABIK89_01640 [Planctomycetota bacterium]
MLISLDAFGESLPEKPLAAAFCKGAGENRRPFEAPGVRLVSSSSNAAMTELNFVLSAADAPAVAAVAADILVLALGEAGVKAEAAALPAAEVPQDSGPIHLRLLDGPAAEDIEGHPPVGVSRDLDLPPRHKSYWGSR